MITRGSLAHCLASMAEQWAKGPQDYLSILHNPKGRYYTLLSEGELAAITERDDQDGHNRLVLRCTATEYRAIAHTMNPNLSLPLFHADAKGN